jgi:acyl dehydratase
MLTLRTPEDFEAYLDKELGVSAWHTISQAQVNLFAEATGDFQWIHTDPERCQKESPFGEAVAHGFLTLSMAPRLMEEIFHIQHVGMAINYGLNKVRFTSHVPVGSRLCLRLHLIGYEKTSVGIKITSRLSFEIENGTKPVCLAESVSLFR